MYVLDAVPMSFALLVMSIGHPGRTLVGPDSEFPHLTRKEKKAAKAAKKAEKRGMKLGNLTGEQLGYERGDSAQFELLQHGSSYQDLALQPSQTWQPRESYEERNNMV